MAESMSFVLFIVVLAVLGYASYLKMRLVRIEKIAQNADKRIWRYKTRISGWVAYADYLESELSRYSTEYAEVRLDYDISRGKVKAAPIKNGNGVKAFALTLPGMAIPSDCDVELSPVVEDLFGNVTGGVPVVVRKPEQKKNGKSGDSDKSNINSAAKTEKTEKQAESKPNDTNKRDPQSVISEIEQTTGKLESHEADRVVTWLKSPKTGDKSTAEYAKWIAGIRKSSKK